MVAEVDTGARKPVGSAKQVIFFVALGWALFLKGDRAGAIALLESAVQAAPADVEINEHLGDAYYAMGRRRDARFAWRAARVYAEGEDATRLDGKIANGLDAPAAAR